MAILTRADSLTGSNKKIDFFSDFVTSFAKTPIGDQLGKVTNERSINQSLRNLLLTNLGERRFQPYVGSDLTSVLFENESDMISMQIMNTINNNEPRVNVLSVSVDRFDDHTVLATIVYSTINTPDPITFNFTLRRVR